MDICHYWRRYFRVDLTTAIKPYSRYSLLFIATLLLLFLRLSITVVGICLSSIFDRFVEMEGRIKIEDDRWDLLFCL